MSYEITVPGPAVPQGRPRLTTIGGHPRAYDPKKSRDYKAFIRLCAKGITEPLNGPVRVKITELRGVPKSWSKRKQQDAIAGFLRPVTRPDLDNIAKTVLDALNGVAWIDDGQITALICFKMYSDNPRLLIEIEEF